MLLRNVILHLGFSSDADNVHLTNALIVIIIFKKIFITLGSKDPEG